MVHTLYMYYVLNSEVTEVGRLHMSVRQCLMMCCVVCKKFKNHIPVCKTVSVFLCVKFYLIC